MGPSIAAAHSVFIQSGRYQVKKGKGSPMFFCFGHHFPVDDALRAKKLAAIRVIGPDGNADEVEIKNEKSLHSYQIKYETPGTYVLTAETTPGFFAMYTDKKGHKRHSLKPMNTFIEQAESVQTSMRSSQWAKTYVVCDQPSEKFPASVGLPLELVPDRDPATLKLGDTINFTVLSDGKQVESEGSWDATYGGFSTEAEDMYYPRAKVKDGKFSVKLDQSGRWFVRFFTKTKAPEEMKDKYLTEKRTATMTFLVRNERKREKPAEH
ncbi:MAG: hypothetical protein CSB24_05905 [Deltaproteobacteria bacterium]|nr:MAG: hypothetical protein CSB24_05905 [Deltaproteobacteria bacterium]